MVLIESRNDHGRPQLLLSPSRVPKPPKVSQKGTSKIVDFPLPFLFCYYSVWVGCVYGVVYKCENVCALVHAGRGPRCTPGVSLSLFTVLFSYCSISTLRVILCLVCMRICAPLTRLVPKEARKWRPISWSWS